MPAAGKSKKIRDKRGGLTQLAATAICGNDITSSCLYVSALSIMYAGKWAPVSLLMVAAVLFLFRKIYAEVVGALPLNGGAYNALLNTTSKFRASIAACLTILSYMATAVISASEAMHYIHILWHGLPVIGAAIGLLALFMVLSIIGITESAKVAIAIFITHIFSLCLLLLIGVIYVASHGTDTLQANLSMPPKHGLAVALFFGFSAAMLGVSGFESSANFVEEQAKGVFPKTLRNMWIAVTVFNPCIALLALALVPIAQVTDHQESLLAHMADIAANAEAPQISQNLESSETNTGDMSARSWLSWLISIDAALVLSGAVLTSFVGVNGLVRRMTLDRCLPQFLLKTNRRGTTHRIIIGFFLLAVSVLLITKGDIKALAGVYTLSFLSVMALFGVGNILLKVKRTKLPRATHAAWPTVLLGVAAVLAGLLGTAKINPNYVTVFLIYFIPAMLIILFMLGRITILKGCLYTVRMIAASLHKSMGHMTESIRVKIEQINAQQVVFFTRGDNISNLNNAILYVQRNEHTNRVKVVTIVKNREEVPEKLEKDLKFLDEAYPSIDIELVVVDSTFSPKLIQDLSRDWNIPTNLMFIGSPEGHLIYDLAELGGVRLII